MTTKPAEVNCTFADTVYKQFLQQRYGVQACPPAEQLAGAMMDLQILDHENMQEPDPVIPA